jgi:hypothetical protein
MAVPELSGCALPYMDQLGQTPAAQHPANAAGPLTRGG